MYRALILVCYKIATKYTWHDIDIDNSTVAANIDNSTVAATLKLTWAHYSSRNSKPLESVEV